MYKILSICKGGGYMYCKTEPLHPKRNSNDLYPLHRVLMENKLGRSLEPGEEVHHEDEDKSNNSLSNLKLLTKKEHIILHRTVKSIIIICPRCNSEFSIKPYKYRLRLKRSKNNKVFCSRSCGASV